MTAAARSAGTCLVAELQSLSLQESANLWEGFKESWPVCEMTARSKAAKAWTERARNVLSTQRHSVEAMKPVQVEGEEIRKTIKVLAVFVPSLHDLAALSGMYGVARLDLTNAIPLLHQVDKLLADLTELTTQYCYCHEYYNADKAMLACDTCNEWFHFECVGVSPPKDDDTATAEFHCPSCLIKGGKEVPGLSELPEVTRKSLEALKAQPQEPPVANGADEEMPQAPAVAEEANAAPLPEPVAAEKPQVAAAAPQEQATAPAEAPKKAVEAPTVPEVRSPTPFPLP